MGSPAGHGGCCLLCVVRSTLTPFAVAFLVVVTHAPIAAATEASTAQRDDAAVDQGWLSPTALTQPAKTVTVETHELAIVRATVAPGDRLQVTVAALLPLVGSAWLGSLTFKLRAADIERFHLAVLGGAGMASAITFVETRERFLSGGVAASFCGAASCNGLLSAYVLVSPTRATLPRTGEARTFARFVYGASLVVPVVSHLKVVTEANVAAEAHGADDFNTSGHKYLTFVAGVRLHWARVAATAGILGVYRWPWNGASGDSRGDSAIGPALSLGGRFGG